MRDVGALVDEVKAAGAWVFNGGLHPPSTATGVRVRDGETLMTDGPYVEGKEHVGGFLGVRAPDPDAPPEVGRRVAPGLARPSGGGPVPGGPARPGGAAARGRRER